MKTRKVGKIVSLLVAIVLVATSMIPAASVLADSSEYAGVTWTEVGDFACRSLLGNPCFFACL